MSRGLLGRTAFSTTNRANDANGEEEGRQPRTGSLPEKSRVWFPFSIRDIRFIRSAGCSGLFPLPSVPSVQSVVVLGRKGGSSDKFLSGVVEVVELEDEESLVPIAVGGAGHDLDLVVDALHAARVDPVVEPFQDALAARAQGLDQALERGQARLQRPAAPGFQEVAHVFRRWLRPQQQELFLQVVGGEQGLVGPQRGIQRAHLLRRQVVPPRQEKEARPLDVGLQVLLRFADQLPADLVEAFVDQFDDVELVEDDGGAGQVVAHGSPVGRAQIHRHRLDLGLGQPQPAPKAPQAGLAAAVGHPDDPAGVQIDDQRVELPFLADVDLVDGQMLQALEAGGRHRLAQLRLDDVLDRVPAQADDPGHVGQRHRPAQGKDIMAQSPGVAHVGFGKGGETSKVLPQSLHWHCGTSAFSTTGIRPMGAAFRRRYRAPLRATSGLWQSGQTGIFFTAKVSSMVPAGYSVRTHL